MPADRGVEARRAARKQSNNDEDIEVKRARGEISCAECRRLKLKCDKKLPCGSCVRRGCTTICPNGSLSAGQGTRFVLADTEQLHRKISEMSERIRQLEDAVAIFQAGVSNDRHPLLRDELLSIKFGPEVRRTVDEEHTREKLSEAIDALGTLTIGDHGETKYFGRSGGSETFLTANYPPVCDDSDVDPMPPELRDMDLTSPLAFRDDRWDEVLDILERNLPEQPRAWSLCETYNTHFTWWCRPVKRDELIDDILIPIYNSIKDPSRAAGATYYPSVTDSARCPHLLAVLYLVLAVGALVDLTLPSCSPEAEKYYRLGRAALSLRSILDSPEIETVQAVTLMASYHSLCTSRYSVESAWTLTSLASKLAQSIGLHRDSKQWKLAEKDVQRRRNLFWEIVVLELIHCVALGRPTTFNEVYVDCEYPDDDEQGTTATGEPAHGFWSFKLRFFHDIYMSLIETLLSAKPPSYTTILEIDRRIRQTTLPPVKLYLRPEEDDYNNPALCMKSYMMSHFRALTMVHIHRTFFAQALLDNPTNPLSTPYAPSFLAANRCASIMLRSFVHHYERCGALCSRFWGMWTHAFSAALVIGATVTRMPGSSLAPNALIELDITVDTFQKGAEHSLRARQCLPILMRLKEKASYSYVQYRDRHVNPPPPPVKASDDALALFGGQTRLISSKYLSRKRPSRRTTESPGQSTAVDSQAPSPTSSRAASTPSDTGVTSEPDLHPSLMMYLSQVPSHSAPFQVADLAQIPPVSTMPTQSQSFLQPMMNGTTSTMAAQATSVPYGDLDFLNGLLNPSETPAAQSLSAPTFPIESFNGMSFPEDIAMSDQWMSLMQETGILEGVQAFSQGDGFFSF